MLNTQTEISSVIVTYNSARYLRHCLAALRMQDVKVHIIIVDNDSKPAERPVLCNCDEMQIIYNSVNRGFAPAVNQGLDRVRTPYVLLLNPDVYLMPSALLRLRTFLDANTKAAAVSPRFWWDSRRTVMLPLTIVPTLRRSFVRAGASWSRIIRTVLDRWQIRQAQRWWFAQDVVSVPAISAGCVLIPTRVLERVGPFDPRFLFYYEEVEWSLRAHRHGYQLFTLTTAEAVHSFGHSSRNMSRLVNRWARVSERHYWRLRHGRLGARLATAMSRLAVKAPPATIYEMAKVTEPPLLSWSAVSGPQILEVAFDPLFESSGAIFPVGNEFQWPTALWNKMPPGTYYARHLHGTPLRPGRDWQWHRVARQQDAEQVGS